GGRGLFLGESRDGEGEREPEGKEQSAEQEHADVGDAATHRGGPFSPLLAGGETEGRRVRCNGAARELPDPGDSRASAGGAFQCKPGRKRWGKPAGARPFR